MQGGKEQPENREEKTGKSNRKAIDKAKIRMIYYGLVSRRGSPGMLLWLSR